MPYIRHVPSYAEAFYLTANAQRNRNHLEGKVAFNGAEFWQEELLFDPQTSGGLLAAVAEEDAEACLADIRGLGLPCGIIGTITERKDIPICVN